MPTKQLFRRLCLSLLLAAVLYAAASVSAASNENVFRDVDWSHVYDYQYYCQKHPSAAKACGGSKQEMLKLFVLKGARMADDGNAAFQVKEYRAKHPSLQKLFGEDYFRYYLYYTLYGYAGDRTPTARRGLAIMSKTVCIDPGHQKKGMYSKEPIGPGSSTYKIKVSSGTEGRWSGKAEYQVVLEIGKKLSYLLQARGYKVVMTRTTHNVSISNAERAQLANKAGADIFIRLHCDGQEGGSGLKGVRTMTAGTGNRYIPAKSVAAGQKLGRILARYQAKATGQNVLEALNTNEMTGLNWAKMPSCIIEMGYMSNPTEDRNLANAAYQSRIAYGLANGVDYYFTGGGSL